MTLRIVRMRTPLHTVHTVAKRLRRCARPRLTGGAHGAHAHREMRTPSAHPPATPDRLALVLDRGAGSAETPRGETCAGCVSVSRLVGGPR